MAGHKRKSDAVLFWETVTRAFWHSLAGVLVLGIFGVEFICAEWIITFVIRRCESISGHRLPPWFSTIGATTLAGSLVAFMFFVGFMHMKGWQSSQRHNEHPEDDKTPELPFSGE